MDIEHQKGLKMTALALTFPVIAAKTKGGAVAGLEPWNVIDLIMSSEGWTPSEKLVVAFLATVWDSGQDLMPSFNVVEALQRWDFDHWMAFVDWARDPFFC